jgi:hypothetical protein
VNECEALEGGELAEILTELIEEAARVGAGVGGAGIVNRVGGGSTSGSTIHAYPLVEGMAAPARAYTRPLIVFVTGTLLPSIVSHKSAHDEL